MGSATQRAGNYEPISASLISLNERTFLLYLFRGHSQVWYWCFRCVSWVISGQRRRNSPGWSWIGGSRRKRKPKTNYCRLHKWFCDLSLDVTGCSACGYTAPRRMSFGEGRRGGACLDNVLRRMDERGTTLASYSGHGKRSTE